MRLLVKTGNECAGAVAAGSITHDTYQKALDRLLRDLRVEKAYPPGPPGTPYSAWPAPQTPRVAAGR